MPEVYESPAQEQPVSEQVADVINRTTELEMKKGGSIDPHVLATRIEFASALMPEATQPLVTQYTASLREFSDGASVQKLPEGVGGQFDGGIAIAAQTLEVGHEGVGVATARMDEVNEHEAYHEEHDHLKPLQFVATEKGGSEVIIGQQSFDQEALIEGLTVAETGDRFVSAGYRCKMQKLLGAIDVASGVTIEDVRLAVNKRKNLLLIDDRTRDVSEQAAMYALAV